MTQKLEAEGLRREITTLSEKAGQEKEALKKATRAHKHRAEKFEAAVDKCYSQLREKVNVGIENIPFLTVLIMSM